MVCVKSHIELDQQSKKSDNLYA